MSEITPMQDIANVSRIRALNDELRRSLAGGVLVMTAGVIALGRDKQLVILEAVAAFDGFDATTIPTVSTTLALSP